MILLLISSLNTGGKEKRFKQLVTYLNNENISNNVFVLKDSDNYNVLKTIFQLYVLIFKSRPKIIHSWSINTTIICYPICKLLSIKIVDSSVSTNGKDGSIKYKLLRKIALYCSDHITVNSISALLNLRIKEKFSLTKNHISFDDKHELLKSKNINIWFIGRMYPGKRVDLFADLITKLNEVDSSITYNVIGGGPLLEDYKFKYKSIQNLFFKGFMTDFFNEFKYRDIGVLISDSEGTPNVLIELMSKGIPCIYYNLDTNIDSPVINSLTGYNVDSLYELQSKLLKLKNNKKMYDLFSQNSRLHVESNYNSKLNLKEFLKIYEKL